MADVDFSNAVMRPAADKFPFRRSEYMYLGNAGGVLFNSSGVSVVTNPSWTMITNTASKVSIVYTGAFIASGTEFYITYSSSDLVWKVSNISFASGDSYSFIVDIEVSTSHHS